MIISDIEYVEEVVESTALEGGRKGGRGGLSSLFQPFFQSLANYQASTAAVTNDGGIQIGNTAFSLNIFMPIIISIGGI